MKMIADLGDPSRPAPITSAEIARWTGAHGLADFVEQYYQKKGALPPINDMLKAAGFGVDDAEAELTYFGIRMVGDRVAELDPEGPAAAAGVRLDDVIFGFYPTRGERPRDIDTTGTRFP
jgi:predicted metalloprotease with PDZ domain